MENRKSENSLPQQDSKMSNGRLSGLFCWPQGQEKNNISAQRYSKFSNGRLSGLFCWPQGQETNNSPSQRHSNISKNQTLHSLHDLHGEKMFSAQPDSKMTKWGLGVLGSLGILRCLGRRHIIENSPAQRYSKMYKSEKIKDKRKKIKGKA